MVKGKRLMKWVSFLAIIFPLFNMIFPAAVLAESRKPVVIKSISYHKDSPKRETITFKLESSVVPRIFFISGAKPRLVLDFPQSVYRGKNSIAITGGIFASAIRIGLHEQPIKKTRVVIDLSTNLPAQYTTNYQAKEHSLIVTLTPDSVKEPPGAPIMQKTASENVQPKKKVISRRPLYKKTLSPDVSARKVAEIPVREKVAAPVVPALLEIALDHSAGRGEMVLFRLNDFHPPSVSVLEQDPPRVICDFMAVRLDPGIDKEILADGRYVKRILTTIHQEPEKVRVVLELLPSLSYDLQQVFFRNENLFVLRVNELTSDEDAE